MTDLDVLVPVWGRAEHLGPMLASLAATTLCDWRVWLIVSPNDPAGLTSEAAVRSAIANPGGDVPPDVWAMISVSPRIFVHVAPWDGGTPGDYARKINRAATLGTAPLLFLGATDLLFHRRWVEEAVALLTGPVQVIGTNDLGNRRTMSGRHSTHTFVTRRYVAEHGTIDEPGKVLHEGYWHEYVDDEFVRTAIHRGVYAHAGASVVEHLHPNWGKREADATDATQDQRMAAGRAVFDQRQHLWGGMPRPRRRGMRVTQVSRRPRIRSAADTVPDTDAPPLAARIIIATYGDPEWAALAQRRALPSALREAPADRVHVLHDEHGTLASVRNQAALTADDEWLVFLDADDELEPGYLTALGRTLGPCPGYDLTCPCRDGDTCHYVAAPGPRGPTPPMTPGIPPLLVPAVRYVDRRGRAGPTKVLNDGRPLLDINRAVIGTAVHSSVFLAAGGFDPRWPLYEDWALWLECERLGARLVDVPAAVYRAHIRPGSRNVGADAKAAYDTIRRAAVLARTGT